MRIQFAACLAAIMVSVASADPPDAPPPIPQDALPVIPPAPVVRQPLPFAPVNRVPGFGDLVLAKVDLGDDGASVIMMIDSYRNDQKKVMVTKIVMETRERTVVVALPEPKSTLTSESYPE